MTLRLHFVIIVDDFVIYLVIVVTHQFTGNRV